MRRLSSSSRPSSVSKRQRSPCADQRDRERPLLVAEERDLGVVVELLEADLLGDQRLDGSTASLDRLRRRRTGTARRLPGPKISLGPAVVAAADEVVHRRDRLFGRGEGARLVAGAGREPEREQREAGDARDARPKSSKRLELDSSSHVSLLPAPPAAAAATAATTAPIAAATVRSAAVRARAPARTSRGCSRSRRRARPRRAAVAPLLLPRAAAVRAPPLDGVASAGSRPGGGRCGARSA